MTLPRYPVFRVMADVRYVGMWFRADVDDLYIIGNTERLTDELRIEVKRHKPAIIEALSELPSECERPTVCLNIGFCDQCRTSNESETAA